MEQLRMRLSRITRKEYLPLWIFAAVQIVFHLLMREPEGSDAFWFFRHQLDAYSLKDYLLARYENWTSRLLIEGVLVYVSRSMTLWKVLDWAAWVFLAWGMIRLFPKEKRETAAWAVVGFLLIYPMKDLRTAGWIATGVNYTWTLSLCVFSLGGAAKALREEKEPLAMWALYALAAVYAANMEQVSAILAAACLGAGVCCGIKKTKFRICGIVWILFFISAAEMLFILRCPGNAARNAAEIADRLPGFASYGFLDKLNLGFMETMHHLVASGNLIFLCYAGVLAFLTFSATKSPAYRFAAAVPVVLNVCMVAFYGMLKIYFPKFFTLMKKSDPVHGGNYHLPENYAPAFLYLVTIGCVLLSLTAVCSTYFELFGQIAFAALALATRVVMGFTPTIFVSQERTYFYLYMILGMCGTYLLAGHEGLFKGSGKRSEAVRLAGMLLTAFCIVINLIETGIVGS